MGCRSSADVLFGLHPDDVAGLCTGTATSPVAPTRQFTYRLTTIGSGRPGRGCYPTGVGVDVCSDACGVGASRSGSHHLMPVAARAATDTETM
jgi:hypothetical protein